MKIAFVVHDYHRGGGHGRYVVELAERFGRENDVHIFANTFSSEGYTAVRFHHVPACRLTALTTILTFLPGTRKIGSEFDIIHAQGLCSLKSDIITSHICTRGWFNARKAAERKLPMKDYVFEAAISPLEKHLYSNVSKPVIAVSDKVRDDLARFYGRSRNVEVIHHGIDLIRFAPSNRASWRRTVRSQLAIRDSDFVFLFIGDLRKGASATIEALARLPKGKLLLVSHTVAAPYVEMARRFGIADRVLFSPATPAIERIYAACDAFVFPTPYDAFGMVVAEAMASGIPVITSREAGVAEWITHDVNGILLDSPRDSAQLSQYMLRILQSPETCEMFAGAARSTVEHHGWDSVARSTMQLYETVVSNGKRE